MKLRRRGDPVSVGVDVLPPSSPGSRITQGLYIVVLLVVLGYVALLTWRFLTSLELRGVVLVDTLQVSASREGSVTLFVEAGDEVSEGDTLVRVDPQLGCQPTISEDSRLEQVRHQLRVSREREKLAALKIDQLQRSAPSSNVRRALELDGTRGTSLLDWQAQLQRATSEKQLAEATSNSLEQRQAEILAQAALGNTLAPECRSLSVAAPIAGKVVSVFRRSGEFIARGEPIVLLEPKGGSPFIEIYPDSDELGSLAIGESVEILLPDGQRDKGTIVSIGAAATNQPNLQTDAYIPLANALRARVEPDAEGEPRWSDFLRMDVEVRVSK